MISWVGLNFFLVIYSNISQLTYSLIGSLVMARRVIWISSVRSSVWKFSWNWLFSFFLELNMMLGANVVLCMTEPDFFKIIFCPKNGENRPSLGFFERIEKFSFFSQFFRVFFQFGNESLYYWNCCMLEQISYLAKFWFLRYGPKCSWPIRLWDFSINRRTLNWLYLAKKLME